MKTKVLAAVLTGVVLVGCMAGCGSSTNEKASGASESAVAAETETASEKDGAASGKKISVILKTTAAEYWQYVQAGCEAYAEKAGVTVEIKGASSETAYDEQLNMIETDVNSGAYDAIVIAPLQADQVITQITGTKLPIIALDTDIDAPEVLSFVGTGNEAAAQLGAEAAVEAAKAAGWDEIKAIDIAGVQGDSTNTARMTGYQKGVEAAGGEFLADETQYADAVADKAVYSMEAIMQNHPEGIAIICANNDDMVMAAARTAKDNPAYENTIWLGFNGDRAACEAILAGEETMSVVQDAYGMGYKAVEAAVQALDGQTLDEFIDSGSWVIDKTNAQERLDDLKGLLD